jgi:CubicO group peptidase (beta-lactamase class C family)
MTLPRLLTAGALAALLASPAPQPDPLPAVDAFIRAEMQRQQIPGVAVGIVKAGRVLESRGFGLANVEHQVPVTADTIFQSGSLGKMFTAAAVMLLVEDGKLALSDPITKFFPGAPAAAGPTKPRSGEVGWPGITVRHLLTHTSGIPNYTDGALDLRKDYSEEQLAQMAYALKPGFAPGEKWQYSNTGYLLLGIIIRQAAGAFYGDVLAERVFKPLGMTATRVISETDIVPHRAAGYTLVKGALKNQGWASPSLNTTADGALYFPLKDLIAWDAGVRAGRILKAASWASVFEPVRLSSGQTHGYGFGWAIGVRGGQPVYQHGGSWQGFKTHYARFDRGDLSVIVLANLRQADPVKFVDGIAALMDPALAPSR